MVFVPPRFAADSILEAADAGIALIIAITEGIPAHDELRVYNHLAAHPGTRAHRARTARASCRRARPTSGIIPAAFFKEGNVGVVSRSGTLTYQIGNELAQRGFGNSSIVGIGGDPVPGSSSSTSLALFEADDETELIVMAGEIGGSAEEEAAEYIAEHVTKPVVAYIAGFTAPPGKTMGHAGAIVSGSSGTAAAKAEALEAHGVRVGRTPTQVAEIAVEIAAAPSEVVASSGASRATGAPLRVASSGEDAPDSRGSSGDGRAARPVGACEAAALAAALRGRSRRRRGRAPAPTCARRAGEMRRRRCGRAGAAQVDHLAHAHDVADASPRARAPACAGVDVEPRCPTRRAAGRASRCQEAGLRPAPDRPASCSSCRRGCSAASARASAAARAEALLALRRARRTRPTGASTATRGGMKRRARPRLARSSHEPRCCSWTSRPRAWTRRAG